MGFVRPPLRLLLCIAAATVAACGDSTGPDGPEPNFVRLESDAGDWIGAGESYSYTESNSTIAVATGEGLASVSVDDWNGEFKAMSSLDRLQPGYYGELGRYPFHNPMKGGLSWSGKGRGCNTLSGWFMIDRVTYTGDVLTALELRFEQHCEEGAPALRGKIRWSA